jgi:L-lysine 2,3-aminomutase
VLLSGGDPLTLSDERLAFILERLSRINHIETCATCCATCARSTFTPTSTTRSNVRTGRPTR